MARNLNWKDCLECGTRFYRTHSWSYWVTARFCSRPCARAWSAARLWLAINKTPDGCWEWPGVVLDNGYGQININGGRVQAHRESWRRTYGEIPDGLWVLHRCDNRPCVRPDHLFLGTAKDNSEDMVRKGRGNSPQGSRSAMAKLDEQTVAGIKRAIASGARTSDLARNHGVAAETICSLKYGRSWKHVNA